MDKENVVHIYNGVLFSHKKELNNAICSNMDRPRDYRTKWGKAEKDKNCMISFICGFQKNDTNKLVYEIETDSQT